MLIGEGVLLDTTTASAGLRVGSALLDYPAAGFGLYISMSAIADSLAGASAATFNTVSVMMVAFWLVGFPTIVETLTRGKSIGRAAAGIRIVRDDGGPITVRHAFTRALSSVIEVWFSLGLIALLSSVISSRGKRLGDQVAGTYALRTRGVKRGLAPIPQTPELEPWARTADMRRLPDGLALSARLFLGRAGEMSPAARTNLGLRFAAYIGQFVTPAPPPGTHAESYIAAVLAARRDREYADALRHQEASAKTRELVGRLPHGIPDLDN